MRNYTFLIISLIAVLLFAGCKGRKTHSTATDLKGMDKEKAVSLHSGSHLAFGILTLKGKANIVDVEKGSDFGFGYRIDIARDSLILMSISKFGIPAMTMLLAKDTVKMRVPLNQTAAVCDYQLLQKMLGMDFDLMKFQDFILGDADLSDPVTLTSVKGGPITLQGSRPPYQVSWILNSHHFRLEKMRITDPNLGKESVLTYSDFEKIEGKTIASTLQMEVTQPQKVRISLHHTAIEFDKEKIDFRFRIPPSYKITPCDEMAVKQPQ